jgi:hypothetical protein
MAEVLPAPGHVAEAPLLYDGGCGPGCFACARNCADPTRFWASAEYLYWWIKEGPLPVPLLTTGALTDDLPGAIGQPGTRILIGAGDIDYDTFSGARLAAGCWLDPDQTLGVEASGFHLWRNGVVFATASTPRGTPILARPFFDVLTNQPFGLTTSSPDETAGGVVVASGSRFWGAEANLATGAYRSAGASFDLLAGFRYLDLGESVSVTEDFSAIVGEGFSFAGVPQFAPSRAIDQDVFSTRNQFYGGQVGARVRFEADGLFVSAVGKVALGGVREVVAIGGYSRLLAPGAAPVTVPGGVLAVPSNIGRVTHGRFAVVPEAEVRLGYRFASMLSAFVGYSFLYLSDVARPGDQIDLRVNRMQVPTSARFGPPAVPPLPAPLFRTSDFWAQGINFGLEFSY